jgi:SAM-dependent methyltransferase
VKRIPEPELMDSDEQARAYASADFSEAHQSYVTLFHETFPDRPARATVLDLGCGAADVVVRFAEANPRYTFHAVDGSAAMLKYARKALRGLPHLARRIKLARAVIPEARLPRKTYDAILSSNLLHHLHDPEALWRTIRRHSKHGTLVFVTDLFRPPNRTAAKRLVERYAAAEPAILQRDFLNSLLASFTVEEVREQLLQAQLGHLRIEVISDRHVMISGRMRAGSCSVPNDAGQCPQDYP